MTLRLRHVRRGFAQGHGELTEPMKIAIIGGGFTGLACALRLSQKNHKITIFEKEKSLGGLAGTFKLEGWQWPLEKHYHHFFTNDFFVIKLIKNLGLAGKLIRPKALTSIYYQNHIYPFNSPSHVLSFSPLAPTDRLRTGFMSAFLKLLPRSLALTLERYPSYIYLKKTFGQKAFNIIWKPLLAGKFGRYAESVNMAWIWARIKKRTLKLSYLKGGNETLINAMAEKIKKNRGMILLDTTFDSKKSKYFDKIVVAAPSAVFIQIFPHLPSQYKKRLALTSHLHALSLIIISQEKFLSSTYWLNINDRKFPFVGIIQQTNMIDKKCYGNKHITYIANYLPENHPYLKMSKEELFKVYLPYLKKINPSFFGSKFSVLSSQLFIGPFAQPVFPLNYSKIKPDFYTPIPNIYLANMDMIYPWDRGVNYAIELGYKVAEIIENQ